MVMTDLSYIIPPVDKALIKKELKRDIFLRRSNFGNNEIYVTTAELFHFTEKFAEDYLPYTVELGRSFVQPDFQPSKNLLRGMYSLDNLWDGLGTITLEMPNTKYFFGKVTMYPDMNRIAKEYILYFYQKHFPDRDGLVWPFDAMKITQDYNELVKMFNGRNYKEDYQILVRSVRKLGSAVPPQYM